LSCGKNELEAAFPIDDTNEAQTTIIIDNAPNS